MQLLQDTASLFQRYVTKLGRNRTLLATNLVTPVLFLVLFSQLLGKLSVFPGVGQSFLAYLTPGIIVMISIMFAAQAGMSIVNDLNSGFLQKMLVTPVDRPAIILGRLLSDSLMIVLSSVLVIAVAAVMGVSFAEGIPGLLLLLLTAALFGLAWAGIFLALGMRTRSPETLNSLASGVVFILLFVSTSMFPASILPPWAQTFSDWNPVSYVATALRSVIEGGYDWSAFAGSFLMIAGMSAIAFAATIYQFRKTVS